MQEKITNVPALSIVFHYQDHKFRFIWDSPPSFYQLVETIFCRLNEIQEIKILPSVGALEEALGKLLNVEDKNGI